MAKVPAPKKDTEARWKAESDARTLTESLDIQGDKTRMAKAQAVLREQRDQIDGILGKIMKGKK